ncbi:DUF4249 domain-containing protein [Flagellimonas sp.]|uniref:DUF4249 domain-containing protein n=1 Tax=Flagellimonas sp. TaxID=2058762 RepID=UPI003B5B0C9A
MSLHNTYRIIGAVLLLVCGSCREEFEIDSVTQGLERSLVVEATITNELKHQEIRLSRTVALDATDQEIENNATVTVVGSDQNSFTFSQNEAGIYVSDIAFGAQPNTTYSLQVTTANGEKYNSSDEGLSPFVDIDNLYAELVAGEDGKEKVQVFVDADGSESGAKYFRYEYEETYKIVAPFYSDSIATPTSPTGDFSILLSPKDEQREVCFTTRKSLEFIQTETTGLEQNIISRFPIRTIETDDSIIRTRYSILARQFTQSIEAFTFYQILDELGNNEDLLSERQPGSIPGNVESVDSNTSVIGFFEVASVASKRIYFDHKDFGIEFVPYFFACDLLTLDSSNSSDWEELRAKLLSSEYIFFTRDFIGTDWSIANRECGDCTTFSSNTKPDFWED